MSSMLRDLGLLFYIVPIEPETGRFNSIDDVPDYVSRAVPYFLLLIALECIYGWIRHYKLYSLKDTIMSISLGVVQQLAGLWMKEMQILPYIYAYNYFAPLRQHIWKSTISYWPTVSSYEYHLLVFIVGFLGCDLGYYFLHRTAHEWQLLWSAHSVHHSGERYNFATALRQGTFQSTYSWFFYIWLAAVGLPPIHFVRHNRLNTVFQFWIHTEIIGRFPWLIELIFNTASHHRMHHRPPGNCNYAGVLIIWDRFFCTFMSERHLPPTKIITAATSSTPEVTSYTNRGVIYGLAKPLNHYDPVYANMSHLLRLTAPKTDADGSCDEDSAGILNRAWKILCVSCTKRIKPNLRVTLSPALFMPDILADWAVQRRQLRNNSYSPVAYLHHLWTELWALPPPVDEAGMSEKIVMATHVPGINGLRAEFSHRDKVFLLGRQAREFPPLSAAQAVAVVVQFLLSLVVGYSVLLLSGKERLINAVVASGSLDAADWAVSNHTDAGLASRAGTGAGASVFVFGGPQGEVLVKYGMAFVCILSVLSLQGIKMYYK